MILNALMFQGEEILSQRSQESDDEEEESSQLHEEIEDEVLFTTLFRIK